MNAGSRARYAIRLSYYVNALIGFGKWRARRDCYLSLFRSDRASIVDGKS